jgi:nucleotide-binding universal stress UspA family protein
MNVLLAVDGSDWSRAAEKLLSQFPFGERPEVRVMHVCPVADLHELSSGMTAQVHQLIDERRKEGLAMLEAAAKRCRAWAAGVSTALRDGHAADEILNEAAEWRPDVIVVGARGLGMFSRALLGSVSDRIVKHAQCSVLVTHVIGSESGLRNILIAHDGSPAACTAAERFAGLPLGPERTVHLLRVLPRAFVGLLEGAGLPPLQTPETLSTGRAAAESSLKAAADRFAAAGCRVDVQVHCSADVSSDILDTAAADRVDLIVLGNRGQSAWERFFLGSVPVRVLHYAPCAVWIDRRPQ